MWYNGDMVALQLPSGLSDSAPLNLPNSPEVLPSANHAPTAPNNESADETANLQVERLQRVSDEVVRTTSQPLD